MMIGCIVQARLDSGRLPRKVLADIGGWPMLKHVVRRMELASSHIIVATPPKDLEEIKDFMCAHALPDNIFEAPECDENDVLKRHLLVAQRHGWDAVMRVTSDCPLIDPLACMELRTIFDSGHFAYVANDIEKTYPDGLGCEIMSLRALRWADFYADANDRVDVSTWILRNLCGNKKGGMFSYINNVCPTPGRAGIRLSVNTQADLDRVIAIDRAKPVDYSLDATLEAYRRAFPSG